MKEGIEIFINRHQIHEEIPLDVDYWKTNVSSLLEFSYLISDNFSNLMDDTTSDTYKYAKKMFGDIKMKLR